MKLSFGRARIPQQGELLDVERSTTPTAVMNLLLRFETINGPRTVIACSVPLQTAREVADAMLRAGHHAEFVDRCASLSISDRVMMKKLQKMSPLAQSNITAIGSATRRTARRRPSLGPQSRAVIAAE